MKKFCFVILSAAVLLTACHQEADVVLTDGGAEFSAVMESFEPVTRTYMDEDRNLLWSKGDLLAIFQGCGSADKYILSDDKADTAEGDFSLTGSGSSSAGSEFDGNVAFYPYMEPLSCSTEDQNEYTIGNVILPQVQTYCKGSFGNGSFPMTAVSESLSDHKLKFRNVCGAMKLQFKGTQTVKSVSVEGKNGERLSGAAVVTAYADGRTPVIAMADDASTSVSLDCGEGVRLDNTVATSFMISLPPVLFSKGFKVTLKFAEGEDKVIETSLATNGIHRSGILVMPVVALSESPMTHVTLTESDEIIANPERGFYAARSTSYPLSKNDILSKRLEGCTVFHIGYYLTDYMQSDIADTYLQRIRNEMQLLRDNGAKCVMRFAYKDSAEEKDKPWDAEPQWVARHIEQLKPVFQEYGDVIMCLQAGFVGVWGEWYYTENFVFNPTDPEEHALRKDVVDALLDAMPSDRTVALRTPMFKRMMYAESYTDTLTLATAYNGTVRARLSCFNDCFGSSSTDYGTFGDDLTREFWKRDTRYVFMGGETCEVSEYCTCTASLKDMEDYHWSYLNNDYHQDVIGGWKSGGCMDEIRRRLGYRLSLSDVSYSTAPDAGSFMHVILNIRNTGFAAPMNGRAVEFVLVDGNGKKTVYECNDIDPRYWFAGQTAVIDRSIRIPEDAEGTCTLYLNLPDPKPTLHDNPLFSIRLANDGIWNKDEGYNRLCKFTIDGSSVSPTGAFAATGENITFGQEFDPWQ